MIACNHYPFIYPKLNVRPMNPGVPRPAGFKTKAFNVKHLPCGWVCVTPIEKSASFAGRSFEKSASGLLVALFSDIQYI